MNQRGFRLGFAGALLCALLAGANLKLAPEVAIASVPPPTASPILLTVAPWFQFGGVTTVAAGSPYIISVASCSNLGTGCFLPGENVTLTIPLPSVDVWASTANPSTATAAGDGSMSATVRTQASITTGSYNVFATGAISNIVAMGTVTFTTAQPSVTSLPSSVIAGGNTSLIASGFDPGAPGVANPESVCVIDVFVAQTNNCATADGAGKVNLSFATLPTDPAGSYTEVLQGSVTGRTASTSVTVTSPSPTVKLSPASGTPGTTFVATASGFTPTESLTFSFGTLDLTGTADSSGKAVFTGALDCQTPPGTYTAAAVGSSSGRQGSGTYSQKASAAAISLSPASVSTLAASTVTLSGTGFTPNEVVDLAGAGILANTTVTADASGAFSGQTFSAGSLAKGSYGVTAVGETSSCRASSTLTLTAALGTVSPTNPVPKVAIVPTSLTFGTGFAVTASNFIPGAAVAFSIAGVSLGGTVTADPSGTAVFSGLFNQVRPNGTFSVLASSGLTNAGTHVSIARSSASITLAPTSQTPGQAVSISGSGFESSEPVNIFFNSGSGSTSITSVNSNLRAPGLFGRAAAGKATASALGPPAATVLAAKGIRAVPRQGIALSSPRGTTSLGLAPLAVAAVATPTSVPGTFTVPVNVPFTFSGNVQVQAIGSVSGQMASAVLKISHPTTSMTGASGAPNDSITISGSGFAPSESLAVSLYTGDPGSNANTDPLGEFHVNTTVPAIAAGVYSASVTGGTSGFSANAALTVFQAVTATPSPTATGVPVATATDTPVPSPTASSGGGSGGGGGGSSCGACGGSAGSPIQPATGGPATITQIPNGGGAANDGSVSVFLPPAALTGASGGTVNVLIQSNPANVPIPGGPAQYSPNGTIRDITITDASGNLVTTFPVPISLTFHYNAADLAMAHGDPHLLTAAYVIDHNSPEIENPMHFPDGTFVIFPPQNVTVDTAAGSVTVQTQALGSVVTVITNPIGYVQALKPTQLFSSFDPANSQVFDTKGQFSYLQVVEPQIGTRLLVLDPLTQNVAYVNAPDVGPSGPPPGH